MNTGNLTFPKARDNAYVSCCSLEKIQTYGLKAIRIRRKHIDVLLHNNFFRGIFLVLSQILFSSVPSDLSEYVEGISSHT